jgi:predicted RNA polymerase sigma factor
VWTAVCAVTLGDRDLAEEAVAEAFARALEQTTPIRNL